MLIQPAAYISLETAHCQAAECQEALCLGTCTAGRATPPAMQAAACGSSVAPALLLAAVQA